MAYIPTYCSYVLDPKAQKEVLSACIQAEAVIRSAHVQAWAAWFSGAATLGAGLLALLAGVLAYRGVLRQVRLGEHLHQSNVRAYRDHFASRLLGLESKLRFLIGMSRQVPSSLEVLTGQAEFLDDASALVAIFGSDGWREIKATSDLHPDAEPTAAALEHLLNLWDGLGRSLDQNSTVANQNSSDVPAIIDALQDAARIAIERLQELRREFEQGGSRRQPEVRTSHVPGTRRFHVSFGSQGPAGN